MFVIGTMLGASIIAVTVAFTVSSYARIPARMPIHFGIDGNANGFGPRWMVWLFVVLQITIAAAYSTLYAIGENPGRLIFGDAILAILAWAHYQAVTAAINGTNRIQVPQFWIGLVALLLVGMAAARVVR